MPNATRNASPTIRPEVSFLLQPWSTATSQTANRTRVATARILIHMMNS
jgi:hypothetical protein